MIPLSLVIDFSICVLFNSLQSFTVLGMAIGTLLHDRESQRAEAAVGELFTVASCTAHQEQCSSTRIAFNNANRLHKDGLIDEVFNNDASILV